MITRLPILIALALPLATLPALACGMEAPSELQLADLLDDIDSEEEVSAAEADAVADAAASEAAADDTDVAAEAIDAEDAPAEVRVIVGAGPFEQAAALAEAETDVDALRPKVLPSLD